MAISEPMSNPSDNWMQLYQNNFTTSLTQSSSAPPPPITTASSAAASATAVSATSAPSRNNNNNNLSPDQGRVAKPIRRRSRASRRTPTTLLNTDTTNFRAMVQQFTGGPNAAASASRSQLPAAIGALSFVGGVSGAPASGFHVQNYPSQQMQQRQHIFLANNMHGGGGSSHAPPPGSSSTEENQNFSNYVL